MIQQATLNFLTALAANNNKPWFDANRKPYEAAKQDYAQLVAQLITAIGKYDAPIADLEVKQCTFRVNRDVRFSKDKSPYKTNLGASFNIGGKKLQRAGYYLHVQPNQSFVAGGIYMPDATMLASIRQEIDYNYAAFTKIVNNKKFKSTYNTLSREAGLVLARPPKGYEATNEAIEYLKLKSFTATYAIPNELLLSKQCVAHIANHFATIQPLVAFINQAVEPE